MIRLKNVLKGFGGAIVIFCATFIVYLFQSFRLDLEKLDLALLDEVQLAFYDAQIIQSNMMLAISCGILGLFAVVTLFFSISKFIKENHANMGILKAMGYERKRIAIEFSKFSMNAFIGCLFAILLGAIFQPIFYKEMSKDLILPNISVAFHPILSLFLIVIPTLIFAFASYFIAYCKLARKPLEMIKGGKSSRFRQTKEKCTYLKTIKYAMMKSHISLIVFVGFSALCFGATIQMSFSLGQLNVSPFFFWMMFGIGLILGISILYLAFGFTYSENKEYVSFMKAYGYYDEEIIKTLYVDYIYVTMIGFGIGTLYQYGLMHFIIELFSETVTLEYNFSMPGLGYTLLIFVPIYLIINFYFFNKLKKLSIREALLSE